MKEHYHYISFHYNMYNSLSCKIDFLLCLTLQHEILLICPIKIDLGTITRYSVPSFAIYTCFGNEF